LGFNALPVYLLWFASAKKTGNLWILPALGIGQRLSVLRQLSFKLLQQCEALRHKLFFQFKKDSALNIISEKEVVVRDYYAQQSGLFLSGGNKITMEYRSDGLIRISYADNIVYVLKKLAERKERIH
jgi:hypothetical protein